MAKSGMKQNLKKPVNQAAELRDAEEFESESDSETGIPLVHKGTKEGGHRSMMDGSTGFGGGMRGVLIGLFAGGVCLCAGKYCCSTAPKTDSAKLETDVHLRAAGGPLDMDGLVEIARLRDLEMERKAAHLLRLKAKSEAAKPKIAAREARALSWLGTPNPQKQKKRKAKDAAAAAKKQKKNAM